MKKKIMVFIPVYNCEKQIIRVINQITPEFQSVIDTVAIFDNISNDNTIRVARQEGEKKLKKCNFILFQNSQNYGLGGSHKAAFKYAQENKFDFIIIFHGDDQCLINDILSRIEIFISSDYDCFLGSRFMKGSKLNGYSFLKIIGNLAFNVIFSLVLMKKLSDLGSGLNMYRVEKLNKNDYNKFPDGLTFNYVMLIYSILERHKIIFFPIFWKEEDQISNVKLLNHGLSMLKLLGTFLISKTFIKNEFRSIKILEYKSRIVFKNF